ncbi:hypothetical protein HDV00_001082 [Rhizophlyctis rosea]|nr:hypothetical protein HDV00_001082 [Rhizophlyctis rosea]
MGLDGSLNAVWNMGKDFDLEGTTLIPDRHDLIYLGQEYPATIIEYNLTSTSIRRSFDVQRHFDEQPAATKSKNSGLESLVHVPLPDAEIFLVGRQFDARIFVFDVPALFSKTSAKLKFRGSIIPPGPGKDLSAMTLWHGKLWLLYDKSQQMLGWDLRDVTTQVVGLGGVIVDASDVSVTRLDFGTVGQEGIAFVDDDGSGGRWVFIGVDPSRNNGPKDLLRYPLSSFIECFGNSHADAEHQELGDMEGLNDPSAGEDGRGRVRFWMTMDCWEDMGERSGEDGGVLRFRKEMDFGDEESTDALDWTEERR